MMLRLYINATQAVLPAPKNRRCNKFYSSSKIKYDSCLATTLLRLQSWAKPGS